MVGSVGQVDVDKKLKLLNKQKNRDRVGAGRWGRSVWSGRQISSKKLSYFEINKNQRTGYRRLLSR